MIKAIPYDNVTDGICNDDNIYVTIAPFKAIKEHSYDNAKLIIFDGTLSKIYGTGICENGKLKIKHDSSQYLVGSWYKNAYVSPEIYSTQLLEDIISSYVTPHKAYMHVIYNDNYSSNSSIDVNNESIFDDIYIVSSNIVALKLDGIYILVADTVENALYLLTILGFDVPKLSGYRRNAIVFEDSDIYLAYRKLIMTTKGIVVTSNIQEEIVVDKTSNKPS